MCNCVVCIYYRYEQYSSDSLDNLAEGGSVGVVISNCSAYFHVNGQNLGPAVSDLPSVPYWVLIDLYGQCVEVKIAPREMERASNSDTAIPLSFHSRCGRFVHLSNNKRSASRIKAIDEFNNGVVLSNRPLNDHELFEVVIVEKVSKWSGSLELGVTANKPEVLEIPSSVSEVKDGMWVLSSNGVVRASDGTTSDTYGATAVDDLPATSRVGVMRKGNGNLHFYINGIDQGVAATHVPSNVYAIVDIYGQTAGVSLSDSTGTMIGLPASAAINIRSYESSVDPLKFHKKCGKFAKIAGNSRTAHRIKPSEEFNYGIVMSDRPLDDNELFEVEIKQLVDRWSGSLEIGVSTQNPEGYEFPSSSMNMRSGTWIMSGSTVQCDGHILCCSYDSDLDILKVGDRVGVLRRTNGDLHFYINGRDLGRAAQQLPARVFGVVDVYGKCSQVALTSDYDGSGKVENSTRSPRSHRNTAETLSSLLGRLHHHDSGRIRHLLGGSNNSSDSESDSSDSSSSNTLDVIATGIEMMGRNEDGPICFHRKCGSNAIINPGRRIANRRNPESEFNGAVCLTSRQLQSGELFEVEINQVISRWSGSLEMGVTLIHPDELDFPDTMTDITYDTWILSGSTVMKGGSLTLRDYTIDLDSIQPGNRIGVMRRENGDLHFYQDGKDVGLAVKDVPPGVYGVVDLYGQCAQVTITSTTSLSDNRGTNTESLFSPPGGWEGLHRFHHYCGRSISMRANNRAARRTASFNNGIVLSSEPLRNGELFEVGTLTIHSELFY
jgi:neuralized-like protein 4